MCAVQSVPRIWKAWRLVVWKFARTAQFGYYAERISRISKTIGMTYLKKTKLPLYCSINTDRHGTQRVRFRYKGGFSCYLSAKPGTPEFKRQYAEALAGIKPKQGAGEATPGTIAKLFAKYYQSPEFKYLSKNT